MPANMANCLSSREGASIRSDSQAAIKAMSANLLHFIRLKELSEEGYGGIEGNELAGELGKRLVHLPDKGDDDSTVTRKDDKVWINTETCRV